jgi:hypothetical protein
VLRSRASADRAAAVQNHAAIHATIPGRIKKSRSGTVKVQFLSPGALAMTSLATTSVEAKAHLNQMLSSTTATELVEDGETVELKIDKAGPVPLSKGTCSAPSISPSKEEDVSYGRKENVPDDQCCNAILV